MDPWQTSVENRLGTLDARLGRLEDKLDRQFKWLVGILVGTGAAMIVSFLSVYLSLYARLDERLDAVALALTALTGQSP